jgi:hypothetical protein
LITLLSSRDFDCERANPATLSARASTIVLRFSLRATGYRRQHQ